MLAPCNLFETLHMTMEFSFRGKKQVSLKEMNKKQHSGFAFCFFHLINNYNEWSSMTSLQVLSLLHLFSSSTSMAHA